GNWHSEREWDLFVNGLAVKNIPLVLASVDKVGTKWRREAMRASLLKRWGEQDPHAALLAAKEMKSPERAILNVLQGWAFNSPEDVVGELKQLPRQCRTEGLGALLPVLGKKNAQSAIECASE